MIKILNHIFSQKNVLNFVTFCWGRKITIIVYSMYCVLLLRHMLYVIMQSRPAADKNLKCLHCSMDLLIV